MGTTSQACATQVLDSLARSGSVFAILHKADAIAAGGPLSDLDVVVDTPARETVARLVPELRRERLHVIMTCRYDVAGLSVFVANDDATEGAQLDLTFDPNGSGELGFRSSTLLERRVSEGRWPTLDPTDELLYLVRKRQLKDDADAIAKLSDDPGFGSEATRRRAGEVFSRSAAPAVQAALRREVAPTTRRAHLEHSLRALPRHAARVLHPVGFWAELPRARGSAELANALAERFGRILVWSKSDARPEGVVAGATWFVRAVAPIRWRPGLFVSVGDGAGPRADLRLTGGDVDDAARSIVTAMSGQRGAVAS